MNAVIIAVVLVAVAGIVYYLRKEKKKGHTCIGCPHAKSCKKKCGHASFHS